jgi:DNA replication protein DnaC
MRADMRFRTALCVVAITAFSEVLPAQPATSNRPVDDWGKLLGDTAAVTALLDRLLHHAHVLTCGPRSWRTKLQTATDSPVAASR